MCIENTFSTGLAEEDVPLKPYLHVSLTSPKAAAFIIFYNTPLKKKKKDRNLLPLPKKCRFLLNPPSHDNTDLHGVLEGISTKAA